MLHKVRDYYESNMGHIMAQYKDRPWAMYESYPFDWHYILNEVEFIVWGITKEKGYMPFYPQFPVLNYFLDFAHPGKKIAIEVDGIEFHNIEKDRKRDLMLKSKGWRVIRIPGAEVVRTNYSSEWEDFDYITEYGDASEKTIRNITDWIMRTGDGVMEAIKVLYLDGTRYCPECYEQWYLELCAKSLKSHMLIY